MIILPSLVASLYSIVSVSDSTPEHLRKLAISTPPISRTKAKVVIRSGIHVFLPYSLFWLSVGRVYSLVAPPPCHWLIRKITNSAGLTGAMPISTISLPSSTEDAGLLLPSQIT